ncbi:putative disease resistance protein At3g14460 [Morus notabilis]|uniref:putative disease resistance protein At3g14460 n=1 Tax=Morus notabilis TaxID=981085 RepID=UPI000CED50BD|nr:putative disease resistance protein At3g14460 [Morus notabilis]
MGGLGKTTLAQLVYDDCRVKEHFDIRSWITISDEVDVFKLTKVMFERITSQKCIAEDIYEVQVELKQTLTRKKFLFIFDDVWNENYDFWDVLKSPFESAAHGSKIILTTRSEIVASRMGNAQSYKLQVVSDDAGWLLFAKHVFNDGDLSAYPDLQGIGQEIVKKCKGLPLAIKSLAGLLRSIFDPKEWRSILKSNIWLESPHNNILPALWLSYHYLPPNIKRCFAYCSIFPKDYIYEKEEMILLWMAEGLLKPVKGKRIEDVGEECFRDLISRSLFQRLTQDESTVIMHELVHDLAIFISGEFCFRLEAGSSIEIPKKVRHLSLNRMQDDIVSKFDVFSGADSLRTVLPLNFSSSEHVLSDRLLYDVLPRLRCLRVLSLSHYSNLIKLPDSIASLRHLRYLDLSHTPINTLPASVSTLYNLQTLKLSNCVSLTQLPHDIGKLVNLRHLYIDGTDLKEMPQQMSGLKNLQTFTVFVVGKGRGPSIKELKHFQNLQGPLSILGLQNVDRAADVSEANFKDKKHLEELVLKWDADATVDYRKAFEVIEKVLPHINLKKLFIENYGGKAFPNWLGDPSFCNIVSLSLTNCKKCTSWPPLGKLPSLKELSIIGFDLFEKLDYEFYGIDLLVRPFGSLEILKFEDLKRWKEWNFPGGINDIESFPRLRELYIENCPELTGHLPHHFPLLEELVIVECPKLKASVPNSTALCRLDLINCDKITLGNISPQLLCLTITKRDAIELLFEEMESRTTCLQELNISDCPALRWLLKGGLPSTLKALEVARCKKLELPMERRYEFLESLSISSSSDSLKHFQLHLFPKLNRLHLEQCKNLESLSLPCQHREDLTSLNFLQISECPNFHSFPKGGLPAPNLTWFWIQKCKKLKSLPMDMHSLLSSLKVFHISDCPLLIPPERGLPSFLRSLSISSCDEFVDRQMKWNLQSLSMLRDFSISNCKIFTLFPPEGLLPPTLTSLYISGISNLKSLNYKELQHLTSLKELRIENCPELQPNFKEGLPSSLRVTHILDHFLMNRCQENCKRNRTEFAENDCIEVEQRSEFIGQGKSFYYQMERTNKQS